MKANISSDVMMLPLASKDKPIVKKLLEAGCCGRCVLRFCGTRAQSSAYKLPCEELRSALNDFIRATEEVPGVRDNTQTTTEDSSPAPKKLKLDSNCDTTTAERGESDVVPEVISDNVAMSICVVCLGVLQDFCSPDFARQIAEAVKAEDYQFEDMLLSVSLPAQLAVREHSCWLHIKQEVREKSSCLDKDDVIQIKEAFKMTVQGVLSKELGVSVLTRSPFEVGVGFIHPDTDEDCHFLAEACSDCFKPTKNKESVFTRMAVVKALEKITDKRFLKEFPCPPTKVKSACVAQEITCLHVSAYVAGRYNKFSRTLPQTPWVIDGERRMESSVEELIAGPLLAAFMSQSFNFSSSGREDVDVRTLGNGRPFAMELMDPHRSKFNKKEIRQLQEEINKASDKIRVRDLQMVTREAMSRMKEGEEEKTKSYSALIWTQKAITEDDIKFIANIKNLEVAQKTPLRVLHRRPLAVRQRIIHKMAASYLDRHHFTLQLKTQAGTYIKEFVHGDFGRTKPNLGELMKDEVDILELDVESVDVDWPPAVPE